MPCTSRQMPPACTACCLPSQPRKVHSDACRELPEPGGKKLLGAETPCCAERCRVVSPSQRLACPSPPALPHPTHADHGLNITSVTKRLPLQFGRLRGSEGWLPMASPKPVNMALRGHPWQQLAELAGSWPCMLARIWVLNTGPGGGSQRAAGGLWGSARQYSSGPAGPGKQLCLQAEQPAGRGSGSSTSPTGGVPLYL